MEKRIWRLFVATLVVIGITLAFLPFGIQPMWMFPFNLVILGLPGILLALHSIFSLGHARASAFIALSMIVGWGMETIGLQGGTLFGGRYVYHDALFSIGIVPVAVVLYWAVFIYTGYAVSNVFLYWHNQLKPSLKNVRLKTLLGLILLDGWLVTAIDLFMDPIQVYEGRWTWIDGGPYFGVPLGNFVGWFVTTIIVTGIFRTYEYLRPAHEDRVRSTVHSIPIFGYALLLVSFIVSALSHDMYTLLLPGILFMLPTLLACAVVYTKRTI